MANGVNIGDYIDGTEVTWAQMSYSNTAAKNCIANEPKEDKVLKEIEKTAQLIIQPCIERFGSIHISSGYRGPELNAAVGGASASQHCKGQAVDFWITRKEKYVSDYINLYMKIVILIN